MNPKYRHLTSLDAIDPLPELGAKVDPNKPKPSGPISREKLAGMGMREFLEHFGSRMTPLAPSMKHHATPRTFGGTLHENMVQCAAGALRQYERRASLPKDAKIYGEVLVWKTRPDPIVRPRSGPGILRDMLAAARTVDPLARIEHEKGSTLATVWCRAEHVGAVEHCVRPLVPRMARCEVRPFP